MSTKEDNWAQLQMAKILVILKQLLTIRIVNFAKTLFFAKPHFCYICHRNAKTKLR